jgi:hypothetical protein
VKSEEAEGGGGWLSWLGTYTCDPEFPSKIFPAQKKRKNVLNYNTQQK